MQKEIENLTQALRPERPFIAVVAGAKYNTKIGPLSALCRKVDKLILGGIIYRTFLCARYGVSIDGIDPEDVAPPGNQAVNGENKPQPLVWGETGLLDSG